MAEMQNGLSESLSKDWVLSTLHSHITYVPTGRVFVGLDAAEQAVTYVASGAQAREEEQAALSELARLRAPQAIREGWRVHVTYCLRRGKMHKLVFYAFHVGVGQDSYILRFDSAREAAEMDSLGCHPEAVADSREHNESLRELRCVAARLIRSAAESWALLRKRSLGSHPGKKGK